LLPALEEDEEGRRRDQDAVQAVTAARDAPKIILWKEK
jgi:hypothetical protein